MAGCMQYIMAALIPVVVAVSILIRVSSAEAANTNETLKLFYWQAPTIVNPHLSPGTKDLSASRIVYEPLASFDSQGNLVPFLASDIPTLDNGGIADDGRSVVWKLKRNVKWADGKPFSAEDVFFTYKYITHPKSGATSKAAYERVKAVEVIDAFTVRVRFKSVNPAWAQPFVGVQGLILPKHIFAPYMGSKTLEAPANRIAIGTGPYQVSEFNEEDILIIGEDIVSTVKIIYRKNERFREPEKPYFNTVILQGGGGDAVVAAQVMERGLADYAWNLQVDESTLKRMETGGLAKTLPLEGAWVERILFNFSDPNHETDQGERANPEHRHPVLADRRIRQAIAIGIDRKAILALYGRGGKSTNTILVSPTRYQSTQSFQFDPQKSRKLLDATGWIDTDADGIRDKNGKRLSLLFQTSLNPIRQQTQKIIKRNLGEIGVEIQLKAIDSSIFFGPVAGSTNTRRHFYADLQEFAYSNKSPDPGPYLERWTCAEAACLSNNWSTGNWARYCNPVYDALYDLSTTEMDSEKRENLVVKMTDALIEDFAVIPLVHLIDFNGVSPTLFGLNLTPWDVEVWNIKDWHRK